MVHSGQFAMCGSGEARTKMPLLLEQRQRTDSIRDWRRIHIPIGVGERPQGNSGPLYGANSNLMAQVPGFIPPCRAAGGSLCPGRPQHRLCRAPGDAGGQGVRGALPASGTGSQGTDPRPAAATGLGSGADGLGLAAAERGEAAAPQAGGFCEEPLGRASPSSGWGIGWP